MLNAIDAISPESYCNWNARSVRSEYTAVNPLMFLTPFKVTFALAAAKLLFAI
nr:MAG TPA: hypothetical protein [Bacteriophage sp.]